MAEDGIRSYACWECSSSAVRSAGITPAKRLGELVVKISGEAVPQAVQTLILQKRGLPSINILATHRCYRVSLYLAQTA